VRQSARERRSEDHRCWQVLSTSPRFLGFLTSDAAELEELKAQKIVPRELPRQSVAAQMQVLARRSPFAHPVEAHYTAKQTGYSPRPQVPIIPMVACSLHHTARCTFFPIARAGLVPLPQGCFARGKVGSSATGPTQTRTLTPR
jgi:hypothetical protein